jgi:hypothetical protein
MLVTGFVQLPGGAASIKPTFASPLRLRPWLGSEPSIAFNASGTRVYVVAPQGGPAAGYNIETIQDPASDVCPDFSPVCILPPSPQWTGGTSGVAYWASFDGGKTFPSSLAKNLGGGTGGWDSDVTVAPNGTVYVADLDITDTALCTSTDGGRTFTSTGLPVDSCQNLALNRQGPETDREWITAGRHGELYLTYHDLAFGFPIMLVSTDQGKTFTPCGSILDPDGPAGINYSPLSGTLVAKPVIGKDGTIYVTVTEPDFVAEPVGASLNHLYVAVLKGGCSPTAEWANYEIYSNFDADFALFNSLAVDGAGILYAVASGSTKANQTTKNTWLWVSKNGGRTWTAPIPVNAPSSKANILPAVVGGLGRNQVAVGWFGTSTSSDPNNEKNQWRYYIATSFDAGRTFNRATATARVIHFGAICDQGVFCTSGRNLADFSSIAVNPKSGCLMAAIPGDPWNRPDIDPIERDDAASQAFVLRQVGGKCLK